MDKLIRYNRFPGGKTKCFTLSYDDGSVHDRRFVETINKYGLHATFHLDSGKCAENGGIRAEELKTLYAGHEIATHGVTHPFLTDIPINHALREVAEDRAALEKYTGRIVRGMSYPWGTVNEEVLSVLKSAGIEYSRTTVSTYKFRLPENFLLWHPTCHHRENSAQRIKEFLLSTYRGLVCYIWGHAHEFERENNWEILTELCEAATTDAGDDWYQKTENVWYATNIEIVDYVNAVRRLKVSMDGKTLYNPSAADVFVEAADPFTDGAVVKIPAGETVHLD